MKSNANFSVSYLICLVLLSVLIPFSVSAFDGNKSEDIPLFVGVSKMNITPDAKVKNWVTGKPYTGIEDSLYVHALVLNDGKDKAVIISWDLVDAGESATDEARKAISKDLGIPVGRILVNASHTHSAPWAPVYSKGYRGNERDTWWTIRHMPAQNSDPDFKKWMANLLKQTVKATRQANDAAKPATMWISRANASEYMNNRRARAPKTGVAEANIPSGYNYNHPDWNPNVLMGGEAFGPLDRTMTLVSFRDANGSNIASLFHLSVHAVAIYPYSEAISADWPGEASKQISKTLGGEAIFIQGTAGDVNPWKRGRKAVDEMGKGLANYAEDMYKLSARLQTDSIKVKRGTVALPLSDVGIERIGQDSVNAEVQVIVLGSLALVSLPGEPLTDLGTAIRKDSPYPQTLVLGYSNGNGVHYVGMPGEKARGGYEMDSGTVGTGTAGQKLVDLALKLLYQEKESQN